MPNLDFWIDWRPSASVDRLRRVLPSIAAEAGFAVREREVLTSSSDWAMLEVFHSTLGRESIGALRLQGAPEARAQLFIAPGARRDGTALDGLNRAALALYCGLLARGLLAPPLPLEVPQHPLVSPEE